ncbi:MAG: YdiU family protein [Polyangiaceae bacterium]
MPAPQFDNSYARFPAVFHVPAPLSPAPKPELVRLNEPLCAQLGLDPEWLASAEGVEMLSGSRMPTGAEPIAMAYAGHQFGGWVPQLGDGRAALIGEVIGRDGVRYDLHLKGSGRTRFSRGGDGKAVLGAVLREYIVSEAMFALGVPTTRSLAAVTTGEPVAREGLEPGAVLTRVAQSHVRVGTFQYLAAHGEPEDVRRLADYVMARHYPDAASSKKPYRSLFLGVLQRQAELVAHWMSLGFIHGVMNTDNMQVAGETIDYGPCAFLDEFHPEKKFSSIDDGGRYSWGNQPAVAIWNLSRLAETLLPLLADDEPAAVTWATGALEEFRDRFDVELGRRFHAKLGLAEGSGDEMLGATFAALTRGQVDFTLFFDELTRVAGGESDEALKALFADRDDAEAWLSRWRAALERTGGDDAKRSDGMRGHNPVFIPRNHRVEQALSAAYSGDFQPFQRLVQVLSRPFEEQPEHAELRRAPEPDEVVSATFCGT